MRTFQAICVALTAVACRGQFSAYRTTGYSISSAPATYHASYSPSVISAGPAVLTRTVAVQSPAVTVAAAAPVAHLSLSAAPVSSVNVVAAAPAARVQTHEIHTGSGRQAIRIEDFQAGDQVIRVHEGAQAAPQIAQVQVPGEQHHVRVVNHQSGPAQVQRVVHRQQTQVFDVQKPGRPGARIVQVVKAESPAPSVEFLSAGGSNHHVYHANDAQVAVAAHSDVAVPSGDPLYLSAAPTLHLSAAPTVAIHSRPVVSVAAAPVTTSFVSGASYGHAIDNTVLIHKKA